MVCREVLFLDLEQRLEEREVINLARRDHVLRNIASEKNAFCAQTSGARREQIPPRGVPIVKLSTVCCLS